MPRYLWGLLLAGLLGGCLPMNTRSSTAPPTPATLTADCSNAVDVLRAYRAPGQTQPLGQVFEAQLAAEAQRRPVGSGRWEIYNLDQSGCAVHYTASIGNEVQSPRWELRRSGVVEANDALARRLSGW